jgi:hypothetical protein
MFCGVVFKILFYVLKIIFKIIYFFYRLYPYIFLFLKQS